MDNPEILSTLDSRTRTKTNKPNYTTQETTKMSYTDPPIHVKLNQSIVFAMKSKISKPCLRKVNNGIISDIQNV
jgi:hypothetical protein